MTNVFSGGTTTVEPPKSVFKELATESQEAVKVVNEKLAVGHKIPTSERFSPEKMREWMNKSKKTKRSSICALYVGPPKIGKSGVLLDSFTEQDKEKNKEFIIYELNQDQGCDVNKKEFHTTYICKDCNEKFKITNDENCVKCKSINIYENPKNENITILNPCEYTIDKEGIWQPDYIATMAKIKSSIQIIKDDIKNGRNIKAIGFDGVDIFLSETCESQMRMDEHVDAAGGLQMRFWKNRNKYFYDVINMILSIDVDKYFITHYAPRSRDDKTGQYNDKRTVSKLNDTLVYGCQKSLSDKMHQIVEFTDKTKIVNGKKQIKIIATMVGDRRSLNTYMDELVIAETETDGKVKWNGQAILEREWK